MSDIWDTKRQVGELVGALRGLRTGQAITLPGGVKVGVVVMGRGVARSGERQFAISGGERREYKRSATEAAVSAMNISKEKERTAA